jgi:hypothetical protein
MKKGEEALMNFLLRHPQADTVIRAPVPAPQTAETPTGPEVHDDLIDVYGAYVQILALFRRQGIVPRSIRLYNALPPEYGVAWTFQVRLETGQALMVGVSYEHAWATHMYMPPPSGLRKWLPKLWATTKKQAAGSKTRRHVEY